MRHNSSSFKWATVFIGWILILLVPLYNVAQQPRKGSSVQKPPNIALTNGEWFNGKSFNSRTVYSVNGRFTFKKPVRVDSNLDLAGAWIVPPFGEAHNHNIGTGVEELDKRAIQKYLADGVFYVQIQGNL